MLVPGMLGQLGAPLRTLAEDIRGSAQPRVRSARCAPASAGRCSPDYPPWAPSSPGPLTPPAHLWSVHSIVALYLNGPQWIQCVLVHVCVCAHVCISVSVGFCVCTRVYLWVYRHVFIYLGFSVCAHVPACVSVCAHVVKCAYLWICMHVCLCMCVSVCLWVSVHVRVYLHFCVCTCASVSVHVCM